MKRYLLVQVGFYPVLLDIEAVYDVFDQVKPDVLSTANQFNWRGQWLLRFCARELLGLEKSSFIPTQAVVYDLYDGDIPVLLELDTVLCLKSIEEGAWQPLPQLANQSLKVFDAVCIEFDQIFYRLRRPCYIP